jgi:DNA-directed RNA polymerase specialized sigma24 family protein
VLDGVRTLPDDRREALIMRFALGMDNREIARALGRSDGATKVLIHRAIKQLEEIVGDRGGASEGASRHASPNGAGPAAGEGSGADE